MKKLLFIAAALCCINLTFAQTTETAIRAQMWNKADADFNKTEIPEKWKNESAVIICQEIKSEYDKYGLSGMGTTKLRLTEYYHKRIKLLDKAAIENYSEFSFADELASKRGYYTKSSTLYYGFKIVKPDGSEEVIDMKDAVDVEGDGSSNIKKIAIPNLEPNDIIDYYFYSEEAFVTAKSYRFTPNISTLSASYSIMKQRYQFTVEKNFYINFKAVNGAPDLTVKEDLENKKIIYSLVDENRPKLKSKIWTYRYREYPVIKFQVIYARKNVKDDLLAFFGESGKAKKSVAPREVADLVNEHIHYVGPSVKTTEKEVARYLKVAGLTKKSSPEEKLKLTYYYLRHTMYNKSIEREYMNRGSAGVSEMRFAKTFTRLLERWEVPFEVLVVANRDYTGLKDLIFFGETSLVLKVNFTKPIYLSNFSMHSRYGELPSFLENAEAYVVDINNTKADVKKTTTPSSQHTNNETNVISDVKFTTEMDLLKVSRKQELSGLSKRNYQNSVIRFLDFIVDDGDKYNAKSIFSPNYFYGINRDRMEELIEKRKKLDDEEREKAVKSSIESDYDVELNSFEDYEIVNHGREQDDPKLIVTENFTLNSFVKKAGRNYILEAGRLIGGQIELEEDDRERDLDIFMPYARSFKYQVNITLPEGYTVQGIDKLTGKVENDTGGFTSSATVEDGVLKISTYKFYRNNFEKMQNWEKMQEFLDAAHDFTQKKVLLKKGN
ncbi:MAG: hypothetical protein ACPGJS_02920 [Flammeovirgaceae bacterium]